MELLKLLTEDSQGQWKLYLSMRGVLPKIGALITREIDHLKHLEESTLSSDLSQGYALKMLTGILHWFVYCNCIYLLLFVLFLLCFFVFFVFVVVDFFVCS